MTNTNLNIPRFTIAPGRPAARVYRLPMRVPGIAARPAPLRLAWSLDPVTGAPSARWVHTEEAEPVQRYAAPRSVFRLAA